MSKYAACQTYCFAGSLSDAATVIATAEPSGAGAGSDCGSHASRTLGSPDFSPNTLSSSQTLESLPHSIITCNIMKYVLELTNYIGESMQQFQQPCRWNCKKGTSTSWSFLQLVTMTKLFISMFLPSSIDITESVSVVCNPSGSDVDCDCNGKIAHKEQSKLTLDQTMEWNQNRAISLPYIGRSLPCN